MNEQPGWCDSCNTQRELFEFSCPVCRDRVMYCKTCLSVAIKEHKCIECFEEGTKHEYGHRAN